MNIANHSAINITCNKYSHKTTLWEDYSNLPRPYYTFAYLIEGALDCVCEQETVHIKKGEILFVPYKIKYQLHWSIPGTAIYSCHFNFPAFSVPFGSKTFPLQKISGHQDLGASFEYLHQNSHSEEAVLGVLSTFYQICDTLFPLLRYQEEYHLDTRIRKAVDCIHSNFRQPVSIDDLAAMCGYSVSHFHSRFKKETGMTAIEFKNMLCIRHAALLLLDEPERSIEEISTECGFQSAEYFRRVFKKGMGVSPRAYRKNMQKGL